METKKYIYIHKLTSDCSTFYNVPTMKSVLSCIHKGINFCCNNLNLDINVTVKCNMFVTEDSKLRERKFHSSWRVVETVTTYETSLQLEEIQVTANETSLQWVEILVTAYGTSLQCVKILVTVYETSLQ